MKDYRKLKALLLERNINYREISHNTGIKLSSFVSRINGKVDWNLKDLILIKEYLELTNDEMLNIFFTKEVA